MEKECLGEEGRSGPDLMENSPRAPKRGKRSGRGGGDTKAQITTKKVKGEKNHERRARAKGTAVASKRPRSKRGRR